MSEREAAGKLMIIPGMVEAAATKPSKSVGVPKLVAKRFSTGLLDIVELSIAKAPMTQRMRKYRLSLVRFLSAAFHVNLNIWLTGCILGFAFEQRFGSDKKYP